MFCKPLLNLPLRSWCVLRSITQGKIVAALVVRKTMCRVTHLGNVTSSDGRDDSPVTSGRHGRQRELGLVLPWLFGFIGWVLGVGMIDPS